MRFSGVAEHAKDGFWPALEHNLEAVSQYLNPAHSDTLRPYIVSVKPNWALYSVGHYEADTQPPCTRSAEALSAVPARSR